jgi:hypothetical protein
MAAQVRDNHMMSRGKMVNDRLEHFAADHQSMYEQEGRTNSVLSEVE